MEIDGTHVGHDSPVYLIAEIGHNHGGQLDRAFEMVETAMASGAGCVKFQTRHPRKLYAPTQERGGYYFRSGSPQWLDEVYGHHREKLEFSPDQWKDLRDFCKSRGVSFVSTPFDDESAALLADLEVDAFKIASGDATNLPFIEKVADYGKPLIVSTGGCDLAEVDALHELLSKKARGYAILQCSCIYPATEPVLNLNVIKTFTERYPGATIGFSTHHPSIVPSIAAYTLGARIIEHHFTNDRDWIGTDNPFSILPEELKQLRQACDLVGACLGSAEKTCDPREKPFATERRKSLYWTRDMSPGDTVSLSDMTAMCPGIGMEPTAQTNLAGRKLRNAVRAFDLVDASQFEQP